MIDGRRIVVVVPAYNEAGFIETTLASVPEFVDAILVVDDASTDETSSIVRRMADPRIVLLSHETNQGVGRALSTGYQRFLESSTNDLDICVVMAGDGQMDPRNLPALLRPLLLNLADYAKGNRLHSPSTLAEMPFVRRLGNRILTYATRLATGDWNLGDSQCGYTAISGRGLRALDLHDLYPRYGYPNDLLIKLRRARVSIAEVPVRAVYGDEVSGIQPLRVVPRILLMLARGFLRRLRHEGPSESPSWARSWYLAACAIWGLIAPITALSVLVISVSAALTAAVLGFLLLLGAFALFVGSLMEQTRSKPATESVVPCES